jgi:hypothetical protein
MAKRVNQAAESAFERREKKPYDGRSVPEGYVLAPVWLKKEFVNDSPDILAENLTTRKYAGITFLIGYVAVEPEKYEALKKDCDQQINAYLKKHRVGRCVIGHRGDGSPILCPKSRRCTGCPEKGMHERFNPVKDDNPEISFTDLTEEQGVEDQYPSFQDTETEAEKLQRLLEHLARIDQKYCDIVTLKLAGVSMKEIFSRLGLKSSRGYQVVNECEDACRKFFNLSSRKK